MRTLPVTACLLAMTGDAVAGPEAVELLRKCQAGSAAHCKELDATMAKPEVKKVIAGIEHKCEKKQDQTACAQFAVFLSQGIGVPNDFARATKLATRACKRNDALGCLTLGTIQQPVDAKAALVSYERACTLKNAIACHQVGILHQLGLGTAQDNAKAAPFYKRACDANHVPACYELGRFAFNGTGIAKNVVQAGQLFGIGCKAAHALSCHDLGYIYEAGIGIRADLAKAHLLYERACDLQDSACFNLAVWYQRDDANRDLEKAMPLHERACNGGEMKSCVNLAVLLRLNGGDKTRAAKLIERACKGGLASACSM